MTTSLNKSEPATDSLSPIVALRDVREGSTSEQLVRALAARIWATPKAQRCAGDSLCCVLGPGEPDRSQYYFAVLQDGQIAGIVGHYEIGGKLAGLTWSGLLPEYRGQGIYRAALHCLDDRIAELYPKAEVLVEIVPPGPRHDAVVCKFQSLGFEVRGTQRDSDPDYDNATVLWRQIQGRWPRWKSRGRYVYDSWACGPIPPGAGVTPR